MKNVSQSGVVGTLKILKIELTSPRPHRSCKIKCSYRFFVRLSSAGDSKSQFFNRLFMCRCDQKISLKWPLTSPRTHRQILKMELTSPHPPRQNLKWTLTSPARTRSKQSKTGCTVPRPAPARTCPQRLIKTHINMSNYSKHYEFVIPSFIHV